MALDSFMEAGHFQLCCTDLTKILQECCVRTDKLRLTREPVKVKGEGPLCFP